MRNEGFSKTSLCSMMKRLACFLLFVASVFILSGCMEKYGRFQMDADVNRSFKTGIVQQEYHYYYTGRVTMPYAIAGLKQGYTISSVYWTPFEPTQDQLKRMSGNIYGNHHLSANGAYILDPEGNAIGIWYSNVRNRTVTVDPETRTVTLLFPNPENSGNSR